MLTKILPDYFIDATKVDCVKMDDDGDVRVVTVDSTIFISETGYERHGYNSENIVDYVATVINEALSKS